MGINSTLRRMSSAQVQILHALRTSKEPIELKKIVLDLSSKYYASSIYRSITNLLEKRLIEKYKRSEYGWGPWLLKIKEARENG